VHKRFLIYCAAVLLIIASASLLSLSLEQSKPAQAASYVVRYTPTPDATTTLNAANDALSHAQDILNIVNIFAAILGIVLTFLSLIAVALTVFGFNSFRHLNNLTKNFQESLESVRTDANNTRQALVYLHLADRLLNQRNTAEALNTYKQAGRLQPNDAQFQYVLGRIYSGAYDYNAAITALETSRSILEKSQAPDKIEQGKVLRELGLAYRRKWKDLHDEVAFKQAIECLQRSVELNPDDSDALGIIGGAYRRKQEYQLAYDYYYRAWKIDPDSSYALSNLASLSWRLGKCSEAQTYFSHTEVVAAARIQRGMPDVFWDYYDLALAQLAAGKTTTARQTYKKAIQETKEVATFNGVLNNLRMLQQAPQPLPGVNEIIQMIEDAKSQM
jgi:tetratricopeptide (TPR) repeat protein